MRRKSTRGRVERISEAIFLSKLEKIGFVSGGANLRWKAIIRNDSEAEHRQIRDASVYHGLRAN